MIYFRRHIDSLNRELEQARAENRALVDTRWHLQSLEAQVGDLKQQLAEASAAQAHIQSLEAQIGYLKEQLVESRQESRELLDRLLAKNNVAPVSETPAKSTRPEIITPFGVIDAAAESAYRASWIREEMEYLMQEQRCDEGTALAYAEEAFVKKHQVIR